MSGVTEWGRNGARSGRMRGDWSLVYWHFSMFISISLSFSAFLRAYRLFSAIPDHHLAQELERVAWSCLKSPSIAGSCLKLPEVVIFPVYETKNCLCFVCIPLGISYIAYERILVDVDFIKVRVLGRRWACSRCGRVHDVGVLLKM